MYLIAIFVGLVAASSALQVDHHYRKWELAHRNLTSLVVEFEFERHHFPLRKRDKSTGSFRLLRTESGEFLARYLTDADDPDKRFEGLLNGGAIYLLDSKTKTATRFVPDDGNTLRFLSDHGFPFAPLLDRRLAERSLRLGAGGDDKTYSYLRFASNDRNNRSIFRREPIGGTVALMRADSPDRPESTPRTIQYWNRDEVWTYDIRNWQINPKLAPDRWEFTKPEARAGWTVRSGLLEIPLHPPTRLGEMQKY